MDEKMYQVEVNLTTGRKIQIRTVTTYKDALLGAWERSAMNQRDNPIVGIQSFDGMGRYHADVLIDVRLITDVVVA